ncbi:uncharacterized protein [Watersipora subatra]|uniref:uncharacterized protein n=1 Tax=Watersipora subatra TaxID=2589382 RepID=UPI00355C00F0
MASDDISVARPYLTNSTSSYENEYPLAAEFKEAIEFVISRCFQYLSLKNFQKAFADVENEELLKDLHEKMISSLHKFMTDKVAEVLDDTQIISSLNELYVLTQERPLTFKDMWRPSGDPSIDLEAHIQAAIGQYHKTFSEMLADLLLVNSRKRALIASAESEILALQGDIAQITKKLKAIELANHKLSIQQNRPAD